MNRGTTRAVIFDLDGTLIDSAPDIHAAANTLMARHGFVPFTPAETRGFIGSGVPHFITCCLRARDRAGDAALRAQLIEEFIELYETAVTLTQVYPGVADALAVLASEPYALGLCTNKPVGPARAVLAHLGLDAHFPVVIGGDSLTVRKPDPAPLRAAVRRLHAEAAAMLDAAAASIAKEEAATTAARICGKMPEGERGYCGWLVPDFVALSRERAYGRDLG